MDLLINLVIFGFLLYIAYSVGSIVERAHYKEILAREKSHLALPVVTSKNIETPQDILDAKLVFSSVVISLDYFKRILAGLRNIVGGRVKSYETLLDRGRREAILRMKDQAQEFGADMVINMRFETSMVGSVTQQKNSLGCFEVLAYGTAIKLRKANEVHA